MPTPPSSPALTELRQQLLELNQDLFSLIERRRDIVAQIQAQKLSTETPWQFYDYEREKGLFSTLRPWLERLDAQERLAFSLLMETQAHAPMHYPAWSEGVHLSELPLQVHHRTNPLLLALLVPELFQSLRLNTAFEFLRQK